MTERKPPGVSFESWVDKQIREAQERGEFAELAGFGKPLEDAEAPYDEMWWIRQKMAREGVTGMLPPALALRKEIEDALASVGRLRSERAVRALLEPLNDKIQAALLRPPPGPPLGRKRIDVDEVVREWRAARGTGAEHTG
ncbi:DUF1992 domain-containing protein [Streptomyces sp. NPDC059070]|uniref:DnaJ family domain-containing protein n=1 Tax=unclassified Streptomyces TaxID=2593676 RepID=UPI0034E1FD52